MSRPLSALLDLETLSPDHYRGQNQALGGNRIFGGQVVAQALIAAGRTVKGMVAHALHANFLRVGSPDNPVDYRVESLRDGRSFATRRVAAIQQKRCIFELTASFQVLEEGLEYQTAMPEVLGPEQLAGDSAPGGPDSAMLKRSSETMRIEIRSTRLNSRAELGTPRGEKYWWIRAIDPLPDQRLLHQATLAYASDFGLIGTAREVHGLGFRQPGVLVASLDHALWFHRDFRFDDWLLYAMDCPNTAGARGFARGQFFRRDGLLLASVTQEGLIRCLPGSAESTA
jgi:acyl-CoA thioesterase-2